MAERAGCLSAAGLVVILTVALTIYGAAAFQAGETSLGVKTLSGRELQRDPLQVMRGLRPWLTDSAVAAPPCDGRRAVRLARFLFLPCIFTIKTHLESHAYVSSIRRGQRCFSDIAGS